MIILALGSNMGDRQVFLRKAVEALGLILRDMRCSPVYESQALLPSGAPENWNLPFLNLVVSGQSALNPQQLLTEVKAIEQQLGRIARGNWGPREIDIDIIAIGELTQDTPELCIPHAQMLERDFVLIPLLDIAPNWRYPRHGVYKDLSIAEIISAKGYLGGAHLRKTQWAVI